MRSFTITRDALKYRAELALAGAGCELATNSQVLLSMLPSWCLDEDRSADAHFTMDVVVDAQMSGERGTPHFRGLHHIVIASFGESAIFIFDLFRRKVTGVVSPAIAQDSRFWSATLLPISIGVLGATLKILPVHCACLALDGSGLLIAGASGAGKSSLSVALAQSGLEFVSDDWTYISHSHEGLSAHGLRAPIKLLPDAIDHFPMLGAHSLHHALNGELAYEVDSAALQLRTIPRCTPRFVILPERTDASSSELTPVPAEEIEAYIENSVERLPDQLSIAEQQRSMLIATLAALPGWNFRYSGSPQFAASELTRLFSRAREVAA